MRYTFLQHLLRRYTLPRRTCLVQLQATHTVRNNDNENSSVHNSLYLILLNSVVYVEAMKAAYKSSSCTPYVFVIYLLKLDHVCEFIHLCDIGPWFSHFIYKGWSRFIISDFKKYKSRNVWMFEIKALNAWRWKHKPMKFSTRNCVLKFYV